MITDEQIALVRESVPMETLCRMYGIPVTRTGFCRCPFHGKDNHPSMKIYPGSHGWHCFTCGEGGDIFHFAQKYEGLGFHDSVRRIAELAGIPLSAEGPALDLVSREVEARRLRREKEDAERETRRKRMIALSEELQWLEERMREAKPLTARYAVLIGWFQKREHEWEELYGAS